MKKNNLFYLCFFALLSLTSCQQEEVVNNRMYSDNFMAKLKFNTINSDETRASIGIKNGQTTKISDKDELKNDKINIGIFSVRIARASKRCLDGFGFCDFKWFPKKQEKKVKQLTESNSLYKNSFFIKSDAEGNKFVDLELSDRPSGLDISKLQPLVVDEQLESSKTINGKEEKIIVPKGTYSFDSSIGKFGGYRVPLK